MARRATATVPVSGEGAGAPLSAQGGRLDGRPGHARRSGFMSTGAVRAAAGSAYAELGGTKVIVSVFGPRESKKAEAFSDTGRLNCDVRYCTFATPVRSRSSPGAGGPSQSPEERDLSAMLYKALAGAVDLTTFAKTTVDVFALVLQSGGGDLPLVISCASLALADAGIVMFDLVAAVSASSIRKQLLLDPSRAEESAEDGGLMLAYMPSRKEITQMTLSGEWSSVDVSEALEMCLDACTKIGDQMRECLKKLALEKQ